MVRTFVLRADVELRGGRPVDVLLDDALDALLEVALRLRDLEDGVLRGGALDCCGVETVPSIPKASSRARG